MCNKKTVVRVLTVAFVLSSTLTNAPSKDLKGKVGVGTAPMTLGTAGYLGVILSTGYALSGRYFLSGGFGIAGKVFMSFNGGTSIGLGGNILFPVRQTDNMNLYLNGGLSIAYIGNNTSYTSIDLPLILEVEYFLQGLPQVGFSIGAGLLQLNITKHRHETDTAIMMGRSSLTPNVGFHYYF